MGWNTEKNTENYLVCYLEILKLYVNLHASLQAFDWLAKLSSMTCDGGDKWDGGGALKLQVLENASMENRNTDRQNM